MKKYRLINYFDVWGNAEDGWTINDQCYVGDAPGGDVFCIADDATDKDIAKYLVDINFLNTTDLRRLYVDRNTFIGAIEICERKGMRPLCCFEEVAENYC